MNEKEYEIYDGIKRREDKAASYDKPPPNDIKIANDLLWLHLKEDIKYSFKEHGEDYDDEHFHNVIWHISTEMLDEKEVSVIVDRDNQLFISKGSRSFVDYNDESVKGMKIPLKCWIHTHPFGLAYFSGTDWYTINTQRPILDSAIVLGDNQKMKWYTLNGKEQLCKIETILLDDSEE